MADILHFLLWYLTISIIGIVAFPITYRFLPRLASKGYAVAKPLGLLIWGYGYWLLCTLKVLQNDLGGEILAFGILLLLAVLSLRNGKTREVLGWIKENFKSVLTIEIVFFVFIALWAVVRAANPEITATEKPMELAFINSILRSPTFPPQDPWLSGYAISYYYFGYVLIAMLIRVTGVVSGVGYNLTAALWYGLTAIAAFGMVYDLVAFWKREKEANAQSVYTQIHKTFARWAGVLGSFFVLVVSNLEGLLEVLHGGGIFWQKAADGTMTSKFWSWLAIQDLNQAPPLPLSWYPERFWAWWRGSRVLQDLSFSNTGIETIDEFPFFSYLLSDLHPHVLAMPFGLLAMAVCLNLFIAGSENLFHEWTIFDWLKRWEFWLTALILGSMAFFNTWDFPIYVGLFCLILIYIKIKQFGWSLKRLGDFILSGLVYGVAGIVLFLPFFLAFKSQAGGLLPSLEFMTRGVHFWVMFAPLLVPIFFWLIHLWRNSEEKGKLIKGLTFSLYLVGGLWMLSSLVGLLFFSAEPLGNQLALSTTPILAGIGQKLIRAGQLFAGVHDSANGSLILALSLTRRLSAPGTWLTLTALLALVWGLLSAGIEKATNIPHQENATEVPSQTFSANTFVLFLLLVGAGLTLFPEFFYLRDQFGSRMNTIFKFYFQAWVFWGIAAAYGTVILWRELKGWKNVLFSVVWGVVFLSALVYPTIMLVNKTNSFKPTQWTLNGNAYIQTYTPDEGLAMDWLKNASMGVVVEAVGGSYKGEFARVSTQTGLPTVIGWLGHEWQWRGGGTEIGNREADIKTLYETKSWDEALSIIEKYDIRYIYVGNTENNTYQVIKSKFDTNLNTAYQNGTVMIYEVPDSILNGTP